MPHQSLAIVVFALTFFLCFSVHTALFLNKEREAFTNEAEQAGLGVFEGASRGLMKPQIQNNEPNEVTVRHLNAMPYQSVPFARKSLPPLPVTNQDTWCIAKPSTSAAKLDQIIQFCCTQPNINCSIIQFGGVCYNAGTNKASDASVVMNLYYQSARKNTYYCNFTGSGLIVTQDPSVNICVYVA